MSWLMMMDSENLIINYVMILYPLSTNQNLTILHPHLRLPPTRQSTKYEFRFHPANILAAVLNPG